MRSRPRSQGELDILEKQLSENIIENDAPWRWGSFSLSQCSAINIGGFFFFEAGWVICSIVRSARERKLLDRRWSLRDDSNCAGVTALMLEIMSRLSVVNFTWWTPMQKVSRHLNGVLLLKMNSQAVQPCSFRHYFMMLFSCKEALIQRFRILSSSWTIWPLQVGIMRGSAKPPVKIYSQTKQL